MKICVGLSGGVDSSVAALLLKQQGYDVFAMYMQNWHDAGTTLHGECEWEEERFLAEMVARKIGIPFYFVDLSKQYMSRVADYMFAEYAAGRTPNPDVLCNREIKFDAFLRAAQSLGADMVATGHYCRRGSVTGEYSLLAGSDPNKDQSYFLCQLSQEQLSKAMFPIGDMLKPDVRELAREADLPSADKKDSQGLCFVGKVDLPTFLKQKLSPNPGDVVEVYDAYYSDNEQYRFCSALASELAAWRAEHPADEGSAGVLPVSLPRSSNGGRPANSLSDEELLRFSRPVEYSLQFETETYRSGKRHVKKTRYKPNPYGRILGQHEGAQFYTFGQRKGLAIGGHSDPLFVIATDVSRNIVYVGEGQSHKGMLRWCLRVELSDIHWVRPSAALSMGECRRLSVRIRYRQPLQSATMLLRPAGLFVVFDTPQRSITPGQFAALYSGDELIGSGVISQ